MKVFKFGGASVKDSNSIKNVVEILKRYDDVEKILVLSAMGKTTNALEKVLDDYFSGNFHDALDKLNGIKSYHYEIVDQLFPQSNPVNEELSGCFEKIENLFSVEPNKSYDQHYDEIVSMGEIIATKILSWYLTLSGMGAKWVDVREIIITDSNFREAKVNWPQTLNNVKSKLLPQVEASSIIITQGFIGSSQSGETTTLGREGSDFTGAILAYCTNAESLTIWKDVPGLLNADPKFFKETIKIESLSFGETVELAYYGASIIHPKTIKPLQNKNIPLHVKSFLSPDEPGSTISSDFSNDKKVPSYIFKQEQVLISIAPRDYSFMDENNLSTIFKSLANNKMKVNMMQNSAISFSVCTDFNHRKLENFMADVKPHFSVKYNTGLHLLTIRNYNRDIINQIVGNKNVLLEQKSRSTVQMVVDGLF